MAAGVRTLIVRFRSDTRGLDSAGKSAGKFGTVVRKATLAAGVGLVAVGAGVLKISKDAVEGWREHQKVVAQTGAVIKATGGVANVTAEEVTKLSDSIERATGVDGDLIQTGANLLLTFKNIHNEAGKGNAIFDRSTQAAVDLSAAGFGSVDSAAKQLGKALNDPLAGITALTRSGITFTESQKEQIKTLVESGDILSAQKIILGEVESQVGGSAKAQMTATDRMMVAWRSFQDTLGKFLIPVIDKVAVKLGTFAAWMEDKGVPALRRMAGWIQEHIVPALRDLASWFGEHIVPALQAVARFIADKVVPAIQALVEWIGKNKEVIPAVGIAIAVLLVPAFIAWAISAGAAAVATIAAAAPVILIGLLIAALAFLIIKNWDTIKDVTLKVFGAVWSFLKGLWEKVTGFIGRAIETVKTIFFRFNPLGIIIKNWGKITGWITDQWSKIKERISNAVGKIKGFFSGMWDGIKNGLKSALNGAISLINSAIGGINTLIAGVNKVPGVSIPSIPTIPRLHSGGVVPGPLGKEVPILARAGERVLTREQDLAGGGGDTNVTVIIDGRAIDESLVRVVRSRDRGLKRRVRAGSGAFA